MIMRNDGPNHIMFKDGQTITFNFPTNKINGILWGSKSLSVEGTMEFQDKKNNLKGTVFF
jgi:hypothetical protein